MSNSPKRQIIIGVAAIALLGLLILAGSRAKQTKPKPAVKPVEIFSVAGVVSKVATKDSYLMVSRADDKKEVKAVLNKDSEIVQLKFPFDPKNPPKEASFTPEKVSITLGDLEIGDNVLVETSVNIFGKTEFDNIRRIQVLP